MNTDNNLLNKKISQRILEHLQALMNSLGQLSRAPLASIFTFIVIGIALALPMGLFVLVGNMQIVSGNLNNTGQINLYLKQGVSKNTISEDLHALRMDQTVSQASYISPKEGLTNFAKHSGFGNLLKTLKNNPIPGVIVVQPSPTVKHEWQVQQLYARVKQLPGVDKAQLDFQWLKRLQAILAAGHRAAILLMIIFAFAVLLIIGNTIRLTTQNHRDEILVIKLIGGTNHFIQRPFLYAGFIYGLAGGIVAWFIIDFVLWSLQGPISNLASLYGSVYQITGPDLKSTLLLVIGGGLLGLFGSWLTVGRYIKSIEN